MGTNYYFYKNKPCPTCGRNDEPMHIGKSSAGWCFTLHIHPEQAILTLSNWVEEWSKKDSLIKDEYDDVISPEEMLDIIENRSHDSPIPKDRKFLNDNYAVPGPNGLLRHKIDRFCVGHGSGTWDLVVGEFS